MSTLLVLGLLIRLDGITAPPFDSAPARQSYDALRARIIYLDGSRKVPRWQQEVLREVRRQTPQLEPPVMEHIAVAGYRLLGSEQLWFPRLISALFWLAGGIFLYLIAMRIAPQPGPLVALAIYVLLPFGIVASRSFQPDPLMVASILAALLAIVRFHEHPSTRRLLVATVVSAGAILTKPAIPVFFLWGVFFALAIERRNFRRTAVTRSSLAFAIFSFVPAASYYVYGEFVSGSLAGHTTSSLQPSLWADPTFWRGWKTMIVNVLAYPLSGLSELILWAGFALLTAFVLGGLRMARDRTGAELLVGLWMGYVVFGLVFTFHIHTHPYYSLPLVPIIALTAAPIGSAFSKRLWQAPRFIQAVLLVASCLVASAGGWKAQHELVNPSYQRQAEVYARIGAIVAHTSRGVHVDRFYDMPLLYYASIASSTLYGPGVGQDLAPGSLERRLREVTAASGRPRFLIVTAMNELETERRLRIFVRGLPVLAMTNDYAIFSLQARR